MSVGIGFDSIPIGIVCILLVIFMILFRITVVIIGILPIPIGIDCILIVIMPIQIVIILIPIGRVFLPFGIGFIQTSFYIFLIGIHAVL